MIKLINLLKEIKIEPRGGIIKVTNKPYKDINADIILELHYINMENGGVSSYFDDSLQNVIKQLRQNPNNLIGYVFEFHNLYQYMRVLGEIYEDTLTKDDVLTLVDYYNNNDDQALLEYVKNSMENNYGGTNDDPLVIENNLIIDPNTGEVITINDIKNDIRDILLPFVTLYNQLGNSYTIVYGDYVGEGYLIDKDDRGISITEPLWDRDFQNPLSKFTKGGYIEIDGKSIDNNVHVF